VHIHKMIELQTVNEDLRKERTTCTFDQEELTNFIDGGVENTEKRRKIGTYIIIIFYITEYGQKPKPTKLRSSLVILDKNA